MDELLTMNKSEQHVRRLLNIYCQGGERVLISKGFPDFAAVSCFSSSKSLI